MKGLGSKSVVSLGGGSKHSVLARLVLLESAVTFSCHCSKVVYVVSTVPPVVRLLLFSLGRSVGLCGYK